MIRVLFRKKNVTLPQLKMIVDPKGAATPNLSYYTHTHTRFYLFLEPHFELMHVLALSRVRWREDLLRPLLNRRVEHKSVSVPKTKHRALVKK